MRRVLFVAVLAGLVVAGGVGAVRIAGGSTASVQQKRLPPPGTHHAEMVPRPPGHVHLPPGSLVGTPDIPNDIVWGLVLRVIARETTRPDRLARYLDYIEQISKHDFAPQDRALISSLAQGFATRTKISVNAGDPGVAPSLYASRRAESVRWAREYASSSLSGPAAAALTRFVEIHAKRSVTIAKY